MQAIPAPPDDTASGVPAIEAEAAGRQRVAPLARALAEGASPNTESDREVLALMAAGQWGTYLSEAIRGNDYFAAVILLEGGADANDLHALAATAHSPLLEFAELLAKNGADFSFVDREGLNFAHCAAQANNPLVFNWIAKKDTASLLMRSLAGKTPLDEFDEQDSSEVAQSVFFCLKNGLLDPNEPVSGVPAYFCLMDFFYGGDLPHEVEQEKAATALFLELARKNALAETVNGESVVALALREQPHRARKLGRHWALAQQAALEDGLPGGCVSRKPKAL